MTSVTHAVIEARGVRKRFGRTWALAGLNLTVASGEIVGLLGPNGSGKSTLLRLLATVARPSAGELRLFGLAPERDGADIRRRVGVLAHASGLYGELTARENLHFAAMMYGLTLTPAVLEGRLAQAGLARAADARVRTFSQGMLQRLALIRATLHHPDLVLLDEPYTALDASGLSLVDRALQQLRQAGKTAVVATHLVERSLRHCDRALILSAGRVVYDGPADAVPASALPAALEGVT
jgi:heme exporter protein A